MGILLQRGFGRRAGKSKDRVKLLVGHSLRRKLTSLTLAISLMALIAAVLALGSESYRRARDAFARHLESQAALAGANLATALAFDDQFVARETLSALGESGEVSAASLFLSRGMRYVSFQRDDQPAELPPDDDAAGAEWLGDGRLRLVHPVELADERVGTLVVEARGESLAEYARSYAAGAGILLAGVLLVAGGLAAPLHRRLTRPLQSLADTMKVVGHRGDFTVRMESSNLPELAAVAEAFHQMLDHLHRREKELAASRDRLESEVKRRTSEHAHTNQELKDAVAELKVAKEAAESASRSKSQFLARMSHEIRTPMNGVLGMTDLLLQSGLPERQQTLAETVYRSGEALLHIINDILDFSKIEAGKLELDALEFSITELLEETLELLAEHAQKKGLELIGWADDAVPVRMVGDPNRLRQVLINLVGNAIKFTRSGEVSVQIQHLHEANDKVILKFLVSDTGLGIAPEVVDRIFDPFSQADGSTTRKYGGTGLGLAICRQLTLMMGGEIGADSEPGVGSTFWFTACFAHPVHAAGEHVGSREALRGVEAVLLTDHRLVRDVLAHRLMSWGIQVKAVRQVEEVISAARSRASIGRPYRLVIVDEGAAGASAVMTLRMLRSDPAAKDLAVVLLHPLTGTSEQEAREAGFAAVVRKPVREAALYRMLAGAIGRKVPREVSDHQRERLTCQGLGVRFDAHILVAEDNLVNQEVIRGMLMNLGCGVTVVNNGREAVESVKDGHYDLVFMDCQMPDMDGFDATRAIKKLLFAGNPLIPDEASEPSPLPIVALTANAMEGDRDLCLSRGMDDYLSKPFRLDQLETMLLRWIPENEADAAGNRSDAGAPNAAPEDVPMPMQWESTLSVPPAETGDERSWTRTPPPVGAPAGPRPADIRTGDGGRDDDDPLDRKTLNSIRGVQSSGVPDLLRRVIESYFVETPKLMEDLAGAVGDGDGPRIRRAAHALKSSSANVGARGLAVACKEIEPLSDAALVDFGPAFLRQVQSRFETIRHALKAELEEAAL